MKKYFSKKLISDSGFTLIELTLTLILTSLISLFILQITTQATKSIGSITDRAISVQTTIRFSNLIKYDFSGSQDVYIHSYTPPTAVKACSSYVSTNSTNVWTTPSTGKRYIRGLFTLKIADISSSNSFDSDERFIPSVPTWVGYEIRKSGNVANSNYELWRVVCLTSEGSVSSSEKLLDLGATSGSNMSALTNSSSYITCYRSDDPTFQNLGCLIDSPTTATTLYYKFILPYDGNAFLIRQLKDSEMQQIRTRIDY
jgi:prepilin-type N-terminal cleavage/methylation domain-containing protein